MKSKCLIISIGQFLQNRKVHKNDLKHFSPSYFLSFTGLLLLFCDNKVNHWVQKLFVVV